MENKEFIVSAKTIHKLPTFLWNIRNESGYRQAEIAQKMDVKQSHISSMENDTKLKVPLLKSLMPYLRILGFEIVIRKKI